MLIKNGKMMLRQGGKVIYPGHEAELPDKVARRLESVGLVSVIEKATHTPTERAVMPEATETKKPEYDDMTTAQLKELCKKRDLPIYGKKVELIARLEGD